MSDRSDRKILVPDGLRRAAGRALNDLDPEGYMILLGLEAALRWLAENPIVPTVQQQDAMVKRKDSYAQAERNAYFYSVEWQRRMFLSPEPDEIPKELHDLTWRNSQGSAGKVSLTFTELDERILEAFNRGRKSSAK